MLPSPNSTRAHRHAHGGPLPASRLLPGPQAHGPMIAEALQAIRQPAKADHIATLRKVVYRLPTIEDEADRQRIEMIIGIYQRLYAHG